MASLISGRSSVKTNRKPKPERRVNLLLAPTQLMPGIVRIQVGNEPWSDYNLASIASDFGRAFRLVKILGPHDRYDVLLAGEHSTCECKGFLRHHHCKHVSALRALVNAGKL